MEETFISTHNIREIVTDNFLSLIEELDYDYDFGDVENRNNRIYSLPSRFYISMETEQWSSSVPEGEFREVYRFAIKRKNITHTHTLRNNVPIEHSKWLDFIIQVDQVSKRIKKINGLDLNYKFLNGLDTVEFFVISPKIITQYDILSLAC